MNTTVSVTLSQPLYTDTKRIATKRGYASIAHVIKLALRKFMYSDVTENGFTPEFEKKVLRASKEKSIGTWKTEKDIHHYFAQFTKHT